MEVMRSLFHSCLGLLLFVLGEIGKEEEERNNKNQDDKFHVMISSWVMGSLLCSEVRLNVP